jgi:serine protease Do
MHFAPTRSMLLATALLLAGAAVHADTPSVKRVDVKHSAPVAGEATRAAVLTDIRSAFAEGERIGTLHSGEACGTPVQREWSTLLRQRSEAALLEVFDAEMSKSGGLVAAEAGAGAPLRVQAFLNDLDAQLCQAAAAAWRGGFYVQVSWQVVSPDSGRVLYQASTEGSFTLDPTQRLITPAAGLREAFGVAVRNFLADSRSAARRQAGDRIALAY